MLEKIFYTDVLLKIASNVHDVVKSQNIQLPSYKPKPRDRFWGSRKAREVNQIIKGYKYIISAATTSGFLIHKLLKDQHFTNQLQEKLELTMPQLKRLITEIKQEEKDPSKISKPEWFANQETLENLRNELSTVTMRQLRVSPSNVNGNNEILLFENQVEVVHPNNDWFSLDLLFAQFPRPMLQTQRNRLQNPLNFDVTELLLQQANQLPITFGTLDIVYAGKPEGVLFLNPRASLTIFRDLKLKLGNITVFNKSQLLWFVKASKAIDYVLEQEYTSIDSSANLANFNQFNQFKEIIHNLIGTSSTLYLSDTTMNQISLLGNKDNSAHTLIAKHFINPGDDDKNAETEDMRNKIICFNNKIEGIKPGVSGAFSTLNLIGMIGVTGTWIFLVYRQQPIANIIYRLTRKSMIGFRKWRALQNKEPTSLLTTEVDPKSVSIGIGIGITLSQVTVSKLKTRIKTNLQNKTTILEREVAERLAPANVSQRIADKGKETINNLFEEKKASDARQYKIFLNQWQRYFKSIIQMQNILSLEEKQSALEEDLFRYPLSYSMGEIDDTQFEQQAASYDNRPQRGTLAQGNVEPTVSSGATLVGSTFIDMDPDLTEAICKFQTSIPKLLTEQLQKQVALNSNSNAGTSRVMGSRKTDTLDFELHTIQHLLTRNLSTEENLVYENLSLKIKLIRSQLKLNALEEDLCKIVCKKLFELPLTRQLDPLSSSPIANLSRSRSGEPSGEGGPIGEGQICSSLPTFQSLPKRKGSKKFFSSTITQDTSLIATQDTSLIATQDTSLIATQNTTRITGPSKITRRFEQSGILDSPLKGIFSDVLQVTNYNPSEAAGPSKNQAVESRVELDFSIHISHSYSQEYEEHQFFKILNILDHWEVGYFDVTPSLKTCFESEAFQYRYFIENQGFIFNQCFKEGYHAFILPIH